MKVLDFDTRSAIAKECINRLSDSKTENNQTKATPTNPRISRMLSDTPVLDKAGANVQLTITSLWLKLSDLDSGNAIFVHEMPNISFASGGDAEKLDFVASRATRHRRMSQLEQDNYPGEQWSLLELWVLQKKKK